MITDTALNHIKNRPQLNIFDELLIRKLKSSKLKQKQQVYYERIKQYDK
jgi:hypothetical protein